MISIPLTFEVLLASLGVFIVSSSCMLGDWFSEAISKSASEQVFIKKVFEDALQGHLCTEIEEGALPDEIAAPVLDEEVPSTPLCRHGKNYYLQKNWVLETCILKELRRLVRKKRAPISIPPSYLEGLNCKQQQAIEVALQNTFSVITGGPGTGKTYTAERIVRCFFHQNKQSRVLLAAPTGKAASRLEMSLPVQAHTLHSLLYSREEDFHLEADLILVDECSMVDVSLFAKLLRAVPDGAHLVLIGDGDQLPPVERGSLFADFVECGKIPCVKLKKNLRSKQEEILTLATAIREGDVETCIRQLMPIDVWKEVKTYYPGPFDEEPDAEVLFPLFEKFCMLSCLRKGALGVDQLNESIFRYFCDLVRPGQWLAIPILITKNDQETGLYNGDMGIFLRHSTQVSYAIFPNKKFPLEMLPPFEYAYVLSVHKSQGSEYEKVVVLAPTGSEVFGREVLYTAATRAKKNVRICGDPVVVGFAVERSARRRSGIKERIKFFLEPVQNLLSGVVGQE